MSDKGCPDDGNVIVGTDVDLKPLEGLAIREIGPDVLLHRLIEERIVVGYAAGERDVARIVGIQHGADQRAEMAAELVEQQQRVGVACLRRRGSLFAVPSGSGEILLAAIVLE